MLDGAQRSICCSSLKTNKKQILRSPQDDMLGGFFSSLLGDSIHRQNGAVLHIWGAQPPVLGLPLRGRLSMADFPADSGPTFDCPPDNRGSAYLPGLER